MTVTIEPLKKLTRILTLPLLGLASLIPLTACDNVLSSAPKHQEDSLTGIFSSAESNTDSTIPLEPVIPALPQKDMTLSTTTLTTLLQSVTIPLNASNILDTETRQCVNDLNISFAIEDVQSFFENNLTTEELDELNILYKTESAIVYTQYGRDQLLVSSGLPLATITQKPADEHMDKIKAFAKSKLGKKYLKLTKQKGEDSLAALVMPLLKTELKNCGVNVEDEAK